jgi:hypothetical protein
MSGLPVGRTSGTSDVPPVRRSGLTSLTKVSSIVLRGATVAAQWEDLLPHYERCLNEAGSLLTFVDSAVGLTAIAMRHPDLNERVLQIITRRREIAGSGAVEYEDSRLSAILDLYQKVLTWPREKSLAIHWGAGHEILGELRKSRPPGHPFHQLVPPGEDPPDEIVNVMPLLQESPLFTDMKAQGLLPFHVAWVVQADLEQLYLPAETLARLDLELPPRPDRILAHLGGMYEYGGGRTPERKAPEPGRNQPCPCGSGKKHKHCCGAG